MADSGGSVAKRGQPGDGGRQRPGRDWQRERLGIQVELILSAIEGAAVYPPGRPADMEYLYVEGRILVRDEDLERVRAEVPGRVVDALVNGLTAYAPEGLTTLAALAAIDAALGVGIATPDHIFYVTPRSCCPATEPTPVPSVDPDPPVSLAPAGGAGGQGCRVEVVDTGLILALEDAQHGWLSGVTGQPEPYDPTDIGPYVGHGTFVAGVVRCLAPYADVHVEDLLNRAGAVTESGMLRQLAHAMDRTPDVISMSAGGTTRHDLPPLGFEVLWEHRLRYAKGAVLVAAAGNNSSRQPFWPAAFPWAVSVGALERDGTRADFSDHGSWVDVYAVGRDIVNAYPDGTYLYREPPRIGQTAEFSNGMATWSGTSFSTPIVAGMIAARMSNTGQSGRQAADSILRLALRNATPGVGAVAEPGMTYDPDPRGY